MDGLARLFGATTGASHSTDDQPDHTANMSPDAMRVVFAFFLRNTVFWRLPLELRDDIFSFVIAAPQAVSATRPATQDEPAGPRGDPSVPPANGSTPLLDLPYELRRSIFAASLPSRLQVIKPRCESESGFFKSYDRPPRRNRTSDLMTLCKKLKNEVALVVYEERVFEIHVHEGLTGGGIEFLDAGRQPLQYLCEDYGIDTRFMRFKDGEDFGFNRLKKINIVIHPNTNNRQERHTAMNTYFMNYSLANMLQRVCEKESDRITLLNISFASALPHTSRRASGRQAIMQADNRCSWWDADKNTPLSTEVHYISDIELMLRPFAILRGVHHVYITLPPKLQAHAASIAFVSELVETIMDQSADARLRQYGTFEMQANAIKVDLYENYVFGEIFGRKGAEMRDLDGNDMQDNEDEDRGGSPKHSLSPHGRGDFKRHKGDGDDDDDDAANDSGTGSGGRVRLYSRKKKGKKAAITAPVTDDGDVFSTFGSGFDPDMVTDAQRHEQEQLLQVLNSPDAAPSLTGRDSVQPEGDDHSLSKKLSDSFEQKKGTLSKVLDALGSLGRSAGRPRKASRSSRSQGISTLDDATSVQSTSSNFTGAEFSLRGPPSDFTGQDSSAPSTSTNNSSPGIQVARPAAGILHRNLFKASASSSSPQISTLRVSSSGISDMDLAPAPASLASNGPDSARRAPGGQGDTISCMVCRSEFRDHDEYYDHVFECRHEM